MLIDCWDVGDCDRVYGYSCPGIFYAFCSWGGIIHTKSQCETDPCWIKSQFTNFEDRSVNKVAWLIRITSFRQLHLLYQKCNIVCCLGLYNFVIASDLKSKQGSVWWSHRALGNGIDMLEPQGQSLQLPWKPPATDRHVFPPEPCWSEHTTEHLFANSPDGAILTLNTHPTTQFPGWGQMAAGAATPCSLCPGQITRKNGLQVPPQAGLCHSPLTTLWWLPMFPSVKRQIVQQTALLWIHPAVHFSKEVKENPWPTLLNF